MNLLRLVEPIKSNNVEISIILGFLSHFNTWTPSSSAYSTVNLSFIDGHMTNYCYVAREMLKRLYLFFGEEVNSIGLC